MAATSPDFCTRHNWGRELSGGVAVQGSLPATLAPAASPPSPYLSGGRLYGLTETVSGWSSLMVRGDPAGNSTSSPLVPAAMPVPSAPPTTAPTAASFVLFRRSFPRRAPPAAPPPMIPAVFCVDRGATLVSAADIGAPNPTGVTPRSKERLKVPALSLKPLFAGTASLTRP